MGVLPSAQSNPIPIPPLTFGPSRLSQSQVNQQEFNQDPTKDQSGPKDPFILFGGRTGPKKYDESVGKKCNEEEVKNLEEFLECTEIQPSENDYNQAKFGTEKCGFERGEICR